MNLYLVHHGDAVGPDVDPRRPLSAAGRLHVDTLAAKAASKGTHPAIVWHSGKLRAKQTAETFWRACNALADFSATRDLQPDDKPEWIADRLRGEARDVLDVLIVGHFPHLPRLLSVLLKNESAFPPHGVVALTTDDGGETWRETWRLSG